MQRQCISFNAIESLLSKFCFASHYFAIADSVVSGTRRLSMLWQKLLRQLLYKFSVA